MEELVEMVKDSEMPLKSYTYVHADSRLTPGQRVAMTDGAADTAKRDNQQYTKLDKFQDQAICLVLK